MKIKYNPSPIYNLILAAVFVYTEMLNIIAVPVLRSNMFQNAVVFIIALGLFFNIMVNRPLRMKTAVYSRFFYITVLYLAVFTVIHCIYSYAVYDEGLRDLFATVRQVVNLLYFLPIIYVLHSCGGYDRLMKDITVMTFVLLVFKTLRALIYNFTGRTVMYYMDYTTRHDRMRMALGAFGGIVFIFCVYKLLEISKKTREYYFYLAMIVAIIFYNIYINMTRMYIIAYFLTFTAMLLVKRRPKGKKLFLVFLVAIVLFLLAATGTISSFLATFSESDEELGSSTVARSYAISYFSQIANKKPLLGLSFLVPNTPIRYDLFFSSNGNAHLDDIGIINMYFHYGISGVILAVLVFGRILYCAVTALAAKSERSTFIVGMLVFLTVANITLCTFDEQRILALPLYWAIFEYEYYVSVKRKHKVFSVHATDVSE